MSDIRKCGFCGFLVGFLRRVMCVGQSKGSSESCYRELAEQDTTERFDQDSAGSSDAKELPAKTFREEVEDAHEEFINKIDLTNTKIATGMFLTMKRKRKRKGLLGVRNEETILDDCYPLQVQLLLSRCTTWEFDTHDLDRATGGQCLPILCMHLFTAYGLIDFFKLLPERCWKLFRSIEQSYHESNPYHNSIHAADVTQAMHCFIQQQIILRYINPMETMMVLLAAIMHDVDHPGVNQSFLVSTNHPLSAILTDNAMVAIDVKSTKAELKELESTPFTTKVLKKLKKKEKTETPESILEHHHWRAAYSCVLESGIFEHLPDLMPEVKFMLKTFILATDITRQNEYLVLFKELLKPGKLDMKRSDHRRVVLQMAIKTADISNPGRPWKISKQWSHSVCEEFYAQGDKELALNLMVSNLCDRKKDTIPKIQKGFFRYVVMPLYTEWHHYLRSDLSMSMLRNLIHNEAQWIREDRRSAPSDFISDADMVENCLETSTTISRSSEMLIPSGMGSASIGSSETRIPRRSSYSPINQSTVKEVIRRYSAPLHPFREPRSRSRAKKNSVPECRLREDLQGMTDAALIRPVEKEKPHFMSMLDIAMVVATDRTRDATEPGASKDASTEETDSAVNIAGQFIDYNSPRRVFVGYTVQIDSDDDDEEEEEEEGGNANNKGRIRIGSVIMEESSMSSGSQLTPALNSNGANGSSSHQFLLPSLSGHSTSAPSSDGCLDRQLEEDVPAPKTIASSCELITFTPVKAKKCDEGKGVLLPQLCISDLYQRRRGSAPAPIAVSELQRLASNLSVQLERRKQGASSCHQLIALEAPAIGLGRRGSLPVEVMTGACISA